jgi:dnaC protein
MEKEEKQKIGQAEIATTLRTTYYVLDKNSIIPSGLKQASFTNFTVSNEIDQKAKNYAMRLVSHYLHDGKGNALIMGKAGRGKSHLAMAVASKLNADWKANNLPKSILFINLPALFVKIQNSFNRKEGMTSNEWLELLKKVDYLILDDLGRSDNAQWKQDFLYSLLDERDKTIITTNLVGSEMKSLFETGLVSRITKGGRDLYFKYPDNAEDRRKLPF